MGLVNVYVKYDRRVAGADMGKDRARLIRKWMRGAAALAKLCSTAVRAASHRGVCQF